MEGADAAPRFLEGLLEAMLQSFMTVFGGLSKNDQGVDGGVYGRRGWTPRCLEYHGCHEA